MSDDEITPEQREALERLDKAIQGAWRAFGKSQNPDTNPWTRTHPYDRMLTEWSVLIGVMGNDESQVDFLLPHFPALPMHHLKGMLIEGLDQLRGDKP